MNKYDVIPNIVTPTETERKEEDVPVVQYPEERNIFEDTEAEVDALKKLFLSATEREKDKRTVENSAAFWFSVYFKTEEQKKEFLVKTGLDKITAGLYIDGQEMAKVLGVEIKEEDISQYGQDFKKFKL